MTALLVCLGLLGLVSLAALTEVRIEIQYRDAGFQAQIHVGPFPIHLGSEGQKEKKQQADTSEASGGGKAAGKTDWKRLLREHWREILKEVTSLLHRPHMALFQLEVIAGGADAADCALAYGHACALIGAGLPLLRQAFRVQKESVAVQWNYQQPKTTVFAKTILTLRVFELVQLLLVLTRLMSQQTPKSKKRKKAVQQS